MAKQKPASYNAPKGKDDPCDCKPERRVISRASWRPWGGTKMKVRCQTCLKEWPAKS